MASFPLGEGLAPRRVRVYLPADYDSAPGRDYPVLYLHDGQNLFDDDAPFGEWQVDETLDALVARGDLEGVLAVGIDNTPERVAEYTPDVDPQYGGGRGDAYLRALVERLKPWVDFHFRPRRICSSGC